MALVDDIKARTKTAMKARDEVTKSILRVALGEIQTAESRAGETLTDEAGFKIIRKLIASNDATLEATEDATARTRLEAENQILLELVPAPLSVDAIVEALTPVKDAIVAAKGDGPATGLAMKHLTASGAMVEGGDVRAAVAQIRG